MRILVTGAAGFLGGWILPELCRAGHEVIGIDRDYGDLCDPHTAARAIAHAPDVVIHLAAQPGRVLCEDDLDAAIRCNVLATIHVAAAARHAGARLIHFSTSEVYGDHGLRTCNENTRLAGTPSGIYALSKRWSEEAAISYGPEHVQIIRPTMPYGPGAPPGRGRRAMDNFLWQAHHRMPITVHRGAERCWCWAGDFAVGLRMVLEHGESGAWNVGRDDQPTSMLEVAEMACKLTGAPPSLIREVDPPARGQTIVKRLSVGKLRALGWEPTVDLEEGMGRMLEWVVQFDQDGRRTVAA